MVTQKMISFKVDVDALAQLDLLCKEYEVNRNKMLNILVKIGIDNMLNHRRMFNILTALSKVDI